MKVLIKGAGDLATGIACRLYNSGLSIVMTDIAVPTAVRRTVAFSRAVYENEATVEGITAKRCDSMDEVEASLNERKIPVVVDPEAEIRTIWKPDVVVDAIIAKVNLGTKIDDADIVIGVGPGFTAKEDCHCVVETKRGHDLGRCLYEGAAIPNTGRPGNIGGYTVERILRAPCDGVFEPAVQISDIVEKDDICGYVDGVPMRSQMPGIVRGLLQRGVYVHKGMKMGDVDARSQQPYCFTVSDKARAIGGGVLEAIMHLAYTKKEVESK